MVMSMGSFATRTVATVVVATDGTGDFTDIQDGIDSLPATGGVVYVKEGTYTITETLNVNIDYVSIIGAGAGTLISIVGNITGLSITNDYCTIEKLRIISDVYPGSYNTGNGIILNGSSYSRISNCWIGGFNHGIDIRDGSDDCVVISNNIDKSYVGILVFNNDTAVTIVFNKVNDSFTNGIYIRETANSYIGANIVTLAGYSALYIQYCDNNIFEGNVLEGHGNEGIKMAAVSNRNIITSNIISNEIIGIHFYAWVPFYLSCDDNIINSNIISECTTGIKIDNAGMDDNIVVSNRIKGAVTPILDTGTNTQIAHNITT